MLPVRCFECLKVIRGDRNLITRRIVEHNFNEEAALASLGYRRPCCRDTIMLTVDRNENQNMYDAANIVKPPNFPPDDTVRPAPRTQVKVCIPVP